MFCITQIDKPDPPLTGLPQHMMTLAMAAPLIIFSVLCASKMVRRGRRHVAWDNVEERRAREAAKAARLKEFVAKLPKFQYSELKEREDYQSLKESDTCTICLDGI